MSDTNLSDPSGAVPPPPVPPPRPSGPPTRPPAPPSRSPARRSWRQRLPELLAAIGAILVAVAVAGFLADRWDTITDLQKAMVLGSAAAALTAAGVWADGTRRGFEPVVGMCWATATLLVAAAVRLGIGEAAAGRTAVAIAGVAAATHAGVLLARRSGSLLQQVALFGALVYAAGPPGTGMEDSWSLSRFAELLAHPFLGLFDPMHASDAFLVTGIAHLVIGCAWVILARVLEGRAALLARGLAVTAAGVAALELNVLTAPEGAVAALVIVLGFLIYGLVASDAGLIAAGAVGCFVAGIRVLVALFSGEVLVTLLVFGIGLALLAYAFHAMRRRG